MFRRYALCAMLASATPTSAQCFDGFPAGYFWEIECPVYEFRGSPLDRGFGSLVENVGDINQDGIDDILVSIRESTGGGHRRSGAVRAYSLGTGAELYTVRGQSLRAFLGATLGSGGDTDGDGVPDWVVGNFNGDVFLHSGANGQRLLSWSFSTRATSITIVGDVNADGHADVLIGTGDEGAISEGAAHLFSGSDGTLIRVHIGGFAEAGLGDRVLALGDRDGDGQADYAIRTREGGSLGTGSVTVYSGGSGQPVYTIEPTAVSNDFGRELERTGDLDRDGVGDFAVLDGLFSASILTTYSGATGASLYAIDTSMANVRHSDLRPVLRFDGDIGDVDGDGIPEIACFLRGEDITVRTSIEIRSGADGSLLRRYHEAISNFQGFGDLAGVGDIDADGTPDFAFGSTHLRRAFVLSPVTRTSLELCAGDVNSRGQRATLQLTRSTSVSENRLRALISDGSSNELAFLFYGDRRADRPFGQGRLCVGGPLHRVGAGTLLNSSGNATGFIDLTTPALASGPAALSPGSNWAFQVLYRDGQSFNLTSAVSMVFRP